MNEICKAIREFCNDALTNYSHFGQDSREWMNFMCRNLEEDFSHVKPSEFQRAGQIVLRNIKGPQLPTIGDFVDEFQKILKSGSAADKYESCNYCDNGRRFIVYKYFSDIHLAREGVTHCNCERGLIEKKRHDLSHGDSFHESLKNDGNIEYLWFQKKTGEKPPTPGSYMSSKRTTTASS